MSVWIRTRFWVTSLTALSSRRFIFPQLHPPHVFYHVGVVGGETFVGQFGVEDGCLSAVGLNVAPSDDVG